MIDVDLNDFYSGGYFLIRAIKPEWEGLQGELLPERLLSFSGCISQRFYVFWGWGQDNLEEATQFGFPKTKLNEFIEWSKTEYKSSLGFPSMFYSVDNARAFIQRFELDTQYLHILGAGLHKETDTQYWTDEPVLEGIPQHLVNQLSIEPGSTPLGFEVVGFDYHDFACSWLCNDLHHDMYNLFDIRPNSYGLLDTYGEAIQIRNWIWEDPTRAEFVGHDVWLMVDYPLEAGT